MRPSTRAMTRPATAAPSSSPIPGFSSNTYSGVGAPAPPPIQLPVPPSATPPSQQPAPPLPGFCLPGMPCGPGDCTKAHASIQAKLQAIQAHLEGLPTKADVASAQVTATISEQSVTNISQAVVQQLGDKFATKEDVQALAARLEQLATKEDLQPIVANQGQMVTILEALTSATTGDNPFTDSQYRNLLIEIQRNRNEIASIADRMVLVEGKQDDLYTRLNGIATTVQDNSGQLSHLVVEVGTVNTKLDAQDKRMDDIELDIQHLDVRVQRYEKEQTNLVRRALTSGGVKFRMTLHDDGQVELAPVEK